MKSMNVKKAITMAAMVVLAGGVLLQAAPIFSDDFNSENGGSGVTNYAGFANWTVSDGTVDLIGNGFFDMQPGYGLYVDMDGSTQNAGKMLTSQTITLNPGTYMLSYELAGNHRNNAAETVFVEVNLGNILADQHSLGRYADFTLFSHTFSVDTITYVSLSFEGAGGDNVGMLLDNVQISAVPVPGAVLLASLGITTVGWLRRRKQI